MISIIYMSITDELHENQTKRLFSTAVEIVLFEVEGNSRLSPVRCCVYSLLSPILTILSSVHSGLSPFRC
jgi:hypothetical protein